jgi:hypothetical protein
VNEPQRDRIADGRRPRDKSGRAVLLVFMAVLIFCAGVVIWLVTRPFREIREKAARPAAEAPARPGPTTPPSR